MTEQASEAFQSLTDSKDTRQKKKPLVWKEKDNITIMQAFLDSTKNGQLFHYNVQQTMQKVKGLIEHNISRKQMYGKIRKFRIKYKSTVEKMKNAGFQFKNKHEEKMFQLMKSAWGCGCDAAAEAEEQQPAYEENQVEFEQEQSALAGNAVINRMEAHTTKVDYSDPTKEFTKEFRAVMTEFSENIKNIVENYCARSTAWLENHLRRSSPGRITYFSVYEPPFSLLDASRSHRLHEKWRNQQILECEAYLQRLALLEEELSMAKTDMESMEE